MVEAINIEMAALTEFYGVISYLLTFTWKKIITMLLNLQHST